MNKTRRSKLSKALDSLEGLMGTMRAIGDAEQKAYENTPQEFQWTARMEKAAWGIDKINNLIEQVDSAIHQIRTSIDGLK